VNLGGKTQKQNIMVTTTIVYDRKKKATKVLAGALEVRVTINRKSYYIATGIKVLPPEWIGGRVCNRTDADELNRRLDIISLAVEREITDCIKDMRPVIAEEVKRKVLNARAEADGGATFLDWFAEQIPLLNLAKGTRKRYKNVHARMCAYNGIRTWHDLTPEKICQMDMWLHKFKGQTGDKIMDSAVYNYHKCLKSLLNRAVMFGLLPNNPYTRLRGKFKRGDKESVEYLTEDEVQRIIDFETEDSMMSKARDLFIFMAFTGLSYSDAQAFDIRDYKRVVVSEADASGTVVEKVRWVNIGQRIKTGVPYVSQLLPPAVEVLERNGMKVPKLSNQKYNQALKAIGIACGISTRMHSHLARHTFATFMLRNGVRPENLKQMLGHKRIEQTLRYAKVVAQSVHDDFDMVAEKMTARENRAAHLQRRKRG
jgi:site-specific recombinase XerD